jgi:hypothetical protein
MQLALRKIEAPEDGFVELASALYWKPEEVVAVIRAYFDESGDHGPNGTLTRLTIGGLIAPRQAWEVFDREWAEALEDTDIRQFHARNASGSVIERFARIITSRIGVCLAFTQHATDGAARTYEVGFIDCVLQAANLSVGAGPISVIFARHSEFKEVRGSRFFDLINFGDARLTTVAFGDPREVLPLQAADLVAHSVRKADGGPLRGCKIFRWVDGVAQSA